MLPKQARGTSRKHVSKPFTQLAAPLCTLRNSFKKGSLDMSQNTKKTHFFSLLNCLPGHQLAALGVQRRHRLRELGVIDAHGPSLLEQVAKVRVEAGGHDLLVVGQLGLLLPVLVRPGANCINIGLPGKSILGDYLQENRSSEVSSLISCDAV